MKLSPLFVLFVAIGCGETGISEEGFKDVDVDSGFNVVNHDTLDVACQDEDDCWGGARCSVGKCVPGPCDLVGDPECGGVGHCVDSWCVMLQCVEDAECPLDSVCVHDFEFAGVLGLCSRGMCYNELVTWIADEENKLCYLYSSGTQCQGYPPTSVRYESEEACCAENPGYCSG